MLLATGLLRFRCSPAPPANAKRACSSQEIVQAEHSMRPVYREASDRDRVVCPDVWGLEDVYESSWIRPSKPAKTPCCLGSALGLAGSVRHKKKREAPSVDGRRCHTSDAPSPQTMLV